MNNLTQNSGFLNPTNFEQAMTLAEMLSQSDLVPKNYKGKQFDIVVAMQMGYEVGLKPLQALQNISVVNGKPTLWGDAVVAICQGSGMLETSPKKSPMTMPKLPLSVLDRNLTA